MEFEGGTACEPKINCGCVVTFKPVAHLWAAYNLYPSVEDMFVDWAFEVAEEKGVPVSQALESDEGVQALEEAADTISELFAFTEIDCLPLFLAIAEKLRQDGEQHFAPGQKKRERPLLDASEMWWHLKEFPCQSHRFLFARCARKTWESSSG